MNRKAIKQQVRDKGIEQAMRLPKGTLTPKMKRFAEAAVSNSGAEAYRIAYSRTAKPKTAGDAASRLKSDSRIVAEIARIERAQELAALHSATGLRSIVISTLAEIATNPDEKGATRVASVKAIGQLVGVDAFRETKRIEHIQDSGEIKAQIMAQLKTMMLSTDEAETVDADSLLAELAPIESANENPQDDSPTLPGDALFATETPLDSMHSNPHERSPQFSDPDNFASSPIPQQTSEHPPSSSENDKVGGYISGEKDRLSK